MSEADCTGERGGELSESDSLNIIVDSLIQFNGTKWFGFDGETGVGTHNKSIVPPVMSPLDMTSMLYRLEY